MNGKAGKKLAPFPVQDVKDMIGIKNQKRKKKMKNKDLEIKGEAVESFERVEEIKEIILLGVDGGIRRIIIE